MTNVVQKKSYKAYLSVGFALSLMLFLTSMVQSGIPVDAMSPSVVLSGHSSAPKLSALQIAKARRLQRLANAKKTIYVNTATGGVLHLSPRLTRLKAAAPDSSGAFSVRPTVKPEKAGCGDGLVIYPEACDDGNKVDGDGCKADCTAYETGYACNHYSQPTLCHEQCGDGIVTPSEKCDDGNTDSNDGCSQYCTFEPFFLCTKANPTVCTAY